MGVPWSLAADEPAAPPAPLRGLWVQQDSGGVMEFRADGRVLGWPVSGTYTLSGDDGISIKSGGETLDCRWKATSAGHVELTRKVDGKEDTIRLNKLEPKPLDLAAMKGKWLIRHMVAGDKTATDRAVTLEESGHFRTAKGGFYFRLVKGPEGKVLGYASGEEDDTLAMQFFRVGDVFVAFDRLEKPRLFVSCLFVP